MVLLVLHVSVIWIISISIVNIDVMLATQLNEKIDSGELKRDSIIRLDSYTLKHQDNK